MNLQTLNEMARTREWEELTAYEIWLELQSENIHVDGDLLESWVNSQAGL